VSRIALLDVNLLVALFDPDHVHHELAHDWFADHHDNGWATCPVTENGFVRVVSHPNYGAASGRVSEFISLLRQFTQSEHHTFWVDSISLRDEKIFKASYIRGHRQVTDIYLLGLAVAMKGCLVTFDRTIPRSAVHGAAPESLHVLSAAGDSLTG